MSKKIGLLYDCFTIGSLCDTASLIFLEGTRTNVVHLKQGNLD